MANDIRFSYSSLSTFRHCEQQFKYRYIDKLESNSDKWKSVKDLGTVIHDGIAEVLDCLHIDPTLDYAEQTALAIPSALEKHDELVHADKVDWAGERDDNYYEEMMANREVIPQLLELYIPMIELGTRYRPATTYEFQLTPDDEYPLIERHFTTNDVSADGRLRPITGIIDAVLYDKELDEYILYDWKVRGRLLDPVNVTMDMQLPLYATYINGVASQNNPEANQITRVRMYQMLRTPPKPAKQKKKNVPSRSASASYWGYWWGSIPYPIRKKLDEKDWQREMADKLRQREDWVQVVDTPITYETMEEVSRLVEGSLDRIEHSINLNDFLPSWGAHACEFCQYKKLCTTRRLGLNDQDVINESFHLVGDPVELDLEVS